MKRNILAGILSLCFLANICEAKTIYYSHILASPKDHAVKNSQISVQSYISAGDALCSQYKLDSAKKLYEKALEIAPENSSVHNGLGMVAYLRTSSSDMNVIKNKEKLFDFAIKEFEKSIKYNPKNAEAFNNLGRVYQEKGDLEKAQANYKKALQINPEFSDAMCNLGSIDFLKNKVPNAIEKYKKALAMDSKNSKAYVYLAEAYASQAKFSEALSEINTSLSLFSNSSLAQNVLGKVYDLQGNEAAAINSYKKSININPENIESYLAIAEIYKERGDNDLAIAELKNAVSINPDYKEGYLKIADMLLLENKPELAINYYKKVTGDSIFSPYALKGLSRAYFNNAKNSSDVAYITTNAEFTDTQDALLKAIDANPDDLQLYLALLKISKMMADDDTVQIYLNQILKKTDFSPVNSLIKGEALLLCGKYVDAEKEFVKAADYAKNVQDSIYIGEMFILNGQYDMANLAFCKALDVDRDNKKAKAGLVIIAKNKKAAEHHYDLAKNFYDENQKNLAILELQKALVLNPKDKKSHLLLAKTYEKLDNSQKSFEHYQAYTELIGDKDKKYNYYIKKVRKLSKKIENKKPEHAFISL